MGLVCCSTLIPKNSVSGKITRQKSTKRSCSVTDDSEFFLLTKRLSGLGEMGLLVLPCEAYRCTLLTRWRSKWANIGHVLFCAFIDRDDVEVNGGAKKERGQYSPILTEQASSITDLLHGRKENIFSRDHHGEGKMGPSCTLG